MTREQFVGRITPGNWALIGATFLAAIGMVIAGTWAVGSINAAQERSEAKVTVRLEAAESRIAALEKRNEQDNATRQVDHDLLIELRADMRYVRLGLDALTGSAAPKRQ